MTTSPIEIRSVRNQISKYVEDGVLDERVIESLLVNQVFIPKECELWDYKRDVAKDAVSIAETVLTIVSFYNTYGGFVIYGVDESLDDIEFLPYGIVKGDLDLRQLRQKIENYEGEPLDISYSEQERNINGKNYLFGLLHIPKRPISKFPIFMGKNGPEKNNGKPVFDKDETFLRVLDKCIPAKRKEHYQLLQGQRENEYLWDLDSPLVNWLV